MQAELTASERVGVHRYTFAAGQKRNVLLDLRSSIYNYPGKVLWSRIRVRNDGTVTGMRETRGWAPGRQLYFAMRFSAPMAGACALQQGRRSAALSRVQDAGNFARGHAEHRRPRPGGGLRLRSFLDAPDREGGNLSRQRGERDRQSWMRKLPGLTLTRFAPKRSRCGAKELSRVEFKASPEMEKSLYTALYHAMMAPSISMDANGDYRGPDNQVHRADGFRFVSSLSLWDVYRAEQPLMTILEPAQRTNDLVRSLIASQQESPFGILPVWQFQGQETWCMIGYHAVPIIADAYMKGIRGYDTGAALDAMVASATYAPYGNLGAYMKLGYVPVDHDDEAASKTVEYAFDDWTIARMAAAMGKASTCRDLRRSVPPTGETTSMPPMASSNRAWKTASTASHSTRPRQAPAAASPRAMPGSTPGTSRRMSRG